MNCCQWPTANDPMAMSKASAGNQIPMPPMPMYQWPNAIAKAD